MLIYDSSISRKKRVSPGSIVWTQIMLIILNENYESMDDQELADATKTTRAAVKLKLKQLHLVRIKPVKVKLPRPATEKPVKIKLPKQKDIDRQVREKQRDIDRKKRLLADQQVELNRKKRLTDKFAIKQVDYSLRQSVRIDSKTIIYLQPGQTAEEAIKKYTRIFSKDGLSKIE